MDFIPYSRQDISEEDLAAVATVLASDFLTQGPAVGQFEQEIAALHHSKFGIAVCNATGALHIACLALDFGPGDILWTSPNSFVASANCARYCGGKVDFVDIDPITRNMSISALTEKLMAAKVAGQLPKIVIPVDFSGLPCDLLEIRNLANEYGFRIISDSSHAVGAKYHGGPIGKYADISVFSFHPVKIVTTGEGGICLTDDVEIAKKLTLLRSHGITRDTGAMRGESDGPWYYEQIDLGFNYRLTDIQAVLGSSQLKRLPEQHAKRENLARRYDQLLVDLPLKLPVRLTDRESAHHLYVVEVDQSLTNVSRRSLFDTLRAQDIGANVHYIPIHLQPYYQQLGFKRGDFPACEAYYEQAITLPLFPSMTEAEQDRVIATLKLAFNQE